MLHRFAPALAAAVVVIGAAASGGCSSSHDARSAAVGRATVTSAPALDDAQIAYVEKVALEAAIDTSDRARVQAALARTRQLADTIVADDRAALRREEGTIAQLHITPEISDYSDTIDAQSHDHVANLRARHGTDYDRAYVADQVSAHRTLLQLIDDPLLRSVHSDALRARLLELRPTIAAHLDEAKRVQEWLLTQP